ncbi:MAG: HlyD family secretion protein [Sedimentisphaerales bacterium]
MKKLQNIKNGKLLHIIAAAVILAVIIAAIYIIRSRSRVTTDDAYIDGRIHTIASKIPGTVIDVNVHDNQNVKTGDMLVKIDPADYELGVHQAQAALDAENAQLLDAEAGIKAAAANLEVQEVSLNQANLDKQRAEALYQKNAMPKEQYEKVITAYNMNAAQVKAAKENLEKAKSLKNLEEALIKQRQAALEVAQRNLGYTNISAPVDGYVTKKSVEVGNQIQPSQPLMAIVALDDIWVAANYKETQLKNVRPGQRVRIKIDTYPGRIFTGKVDSIMAGTGAVFSLFPPENALGNYVKVVQRIPVKIVFDKDLNNTDVLRIGMSCVPTIITKD